MRAVLRKESRRFAVAFGGLLLAAQLPAHAAIEYVHTDSLGTPVAITDSDGNVIQASEYEPYGKLLNRGLTDGPGYTAHDTDATTGMVYMQQRYYDPAIGRFLSLDPLQTASTGDNFNRYKYGRNNPYFFVDPDGRADINFFHKEDALYDAAKRFDIPGFTTVMGHAWWGGYEDDRDAPGPKLGTSVSTDALIRDISTVTRRGDYIFLGGCSLAFGNTPAAIAKQFNTKVLAAVGYVIRKDGKDGSITYTVNHNTDGKGSPGYFNITNPDGSASGRIGSVKMTSDGKVTFTAADPQTGTHIRSQVTIAAERQDHTDGN